MYEPPIEIPGSSESCEADDIEMRAADRAYKAGQQILDGLPDYDRFIIESITETLRKWIDKQRHDVVWLHRMDIDQLESWAKDLAKQYRDTELHAAAMDAEMLQQPNEGWTPAEHWPHRSV